MTPIGKKRLLKLAEILDTADAEHRKKGEPTYNQDQLIHPCGTPACALGHWAEYSRRLKIVPANCGSRYVVEFKDSATFRPTIDQIAYDEFGLSATHADELFGFVGCGGAKTAKQAARYIRSFVKRIEKQEKARVRAMEEAA